MIYLVFISYQNNKLKNHLYLVTNKYFKYQVKKFKVQVNITDR